MLAQRIKAHTQPHDARACAQHVRDDEEETADLAHDGPADDVGHVGDGVALRVRVAEVALHDGEVRVECAPADYAERPADGA